MFWDLFLIQISDVSKTLVEIKVIF
jgi:hypothetical protein